jgi:hypothetical protein
MRKRFQKGSRKRVGRQCSLMVVRRTQTEGSMVSSRDDKEQGESETRGDAGTSQRPRLACSSGQAEAKRRPTCGEFAEETHLPFYRG